MGKGQKAIIVSALFIAFLAGTIVAAPQASAANPVLTFLQTTILDLLNSIESTVSGNSDKLDDIDTRLANLEAVLIGVCGDGTIDSGEECDDGNTTDDDGCDALCSLEICGNGVIQEHLGESCDDGNTVDGDGCDADCSLEICGNGVLQEHLGEECDDGGNSAVCDADCTFPACNDGICNPEAGEDANTCPNDCFIG